MESLKKSVCILSIFSFKLSHTSKVQIMLYDFDAFHLHRRSLLFSITRSLRDFWDVVPRDECWEFSNNQRQNVFWLPFLEEVKVFLDWEECFTIETKKCYDLRPKWNLRLQDKASSAIRENTYILYWNSLQQDFSVRMLTIT